MLNKTKKIKKCRQSQIRPGRINQLLYSVATKIMLENECDVKLSENKISAKRRNLGSLLRSYTNMDRLDKIENV